MPKKLNIKQVTLKKVTITAGDQTLTLKFPFSHRIAEALGWAQELPEMTGTWSPDAPHNRVEVRTIEFRPTDETQGGRGFQLECHGYMENFAVVRKAAKGKDSKKAGIKKTDITCTVAFADENGAMLIAPYMRAVPTSSVSVSYDPSPIQEEFPGTEAQDEPVFEAYAAAVELAKTMMDEAMAETEQEFGAETAQDAADVPVGQEPWEEPATDEPAATVKRGRGRPRKSA